MNVRDAISQCLYRPVQLMVKDIIHTGVPMFLDFMSEVEALLRGALERCGFKVEEGVNNLGLDLCPHADLASSVAFRLAPVLKKSPAAIAKEIHQAISPEYKYVERVELAGPYLNFFMNQKFLNTSWTRHWQTTPGRAG